MAYSTVTLNQFINQIAELMDDPGKVYWVQDEIQSAVYEGLRVWGAYTNYWRSRGVFNVKPTDFTPYYDMSVVLPALRTRTYTLQQMVKEIQWMLLENPSGVAGTGMSGQVTVSAILNAIQISRNRLVIDTKLPLTIRQFNDPPSPSGEIEFSQDTVYLHRASWKDVYSGIWANLWRQDAWASDKNNQTWTLEPGVPQTFSEAENAPLLIQLVPPPVNIGLLEAVIVKSLQVDITDPTATFQVPDEWVHAIKYAALSYLLYGEGQIKDVLRAQYAEQRYMQAVQFAVNARSVMRLLLNNVPLPLDTLYNIDSGFCYWRNQSGPPQVCGTMYDFVVIAPGIPNQEYSIAADVVQTAPLPQGNDYIQMGTEDLDTLSDYVTHLLTFKCGGQEFTSTLPGYDSFLQCVARRKGINAAKIQYLTPLLGQPNKEWQQRPDRMENVNA
jgi:hypothetical protein